MLDGFALSGPLIDQVIEAVLADAKALGRSKRRAWKNAFLTPSLEDSLRKRGFLFVAGVDEAGRGPLAGPVVASAVVLPEGFDLPGLRDSKQMTPERRLALFPRIREEALAVGIGIVTAGGIDRWNILGATREAMDRAIRSLDRRPDWIIVDGNRMSGLRLPQIAVIKGDRRIPSIAAASVIAKVFRDRMMAGYDKLYPVYGFSGHKGYPTTDHAAAIHRHGSSSIHRKSFHVPVIEGDGLWNEGKSEEEARSTRRAT